MTITLERGASKSGPPWRLIGWSIPLFLLSLPLVFGAPWSLGDYVVAAAVLAFFGATFELVVRTNRSKWYRAGAAMALATIFLLVWINGAVGIIGNEDNPANLAFVVVILMALSGAIAARFEAAGMARAMAVAAAAQALVAVAALSYGLGAMEAPGLIGVVILIAAFAVMWLISAALFAKAATIGR